MDDFVSPFYLGSVKKCVYIVDIECIIDPLFVFQDIGGSAPKSERHFCVLPYQKWGRYFGDKVNLESDDDDVNGGGSDDDYGNNEEEGVSKMTVIMRWITPHKT